MSAVLERFETAAAEDAAREEQYPMERVCAWCGTHLGWTTSATPGETTHGMCSECFVSMFQLSLVGRPVRLKESGQEGTIVELQEVSTGWRLVVDCGGCRIGRRPNDMEVM